jgi:iron complex transport system substrate-binding protein
MPVSRSGPTRIVCLTEETTETLYLLGEQGRIAGVSGFTARPPEARRKPKVSAFTSAKIDRILDLKPDLVLGFSDLQAEIARDLISAGLNVMVFNQRSVTEILEMILTLSRLVDAATRGIDLVSSLRRGMDQIAEHARQFSHRPRTYFEEWGDPLISGIRWVDELIEIAGGTSVFPELRNEPGARRRIVQPSAVASRNPELILASWCGRKVNKQAIRQREGWNEIAAVQNGNLYEIKSTYILQPGPASLTEGVRQIHHILSLVCGCPPDPELMPLERVDPDLNLAGDGRTTAMPPVEPEEKREATGTRTQTDNQVSRRR